MGCNIAARGLSGPDTQVFIKNSNIIALSLYSAASADEDAPLESRTCCCQLFAVSNRPSLALHKNGKRQALRWHENTEPPMRVINSTKVREGLKISVMDLGFGNRLWTWRNRLFPCGSRAKSRKAST